jgi:hypothetical protein
MPKVPKWKQQRAADKDMQDTIQNDMEREMEQGYKTRPESEWPDIDKAANARAVQRWNEHKGIHSVQFKKPQGNVALDIEAKKYD